MHYGYHGIWPVAARDMILATCDVKEGDKKMYTLGRSIET
jgi:hypothetical protein